MEFQIKLLVMSKVAEGNMERAHAGEVNTAYKLYRVWNTRNVSFGKISRKYAMPETFTRLFTISLRKLYSYGNNDGGLNLWTDPTTNYPFYRRPRTQIVGSIDRS